MIGETAGSYRIVSKLSEGGMGAVYRAEHALLGRAAAVKVLLPELSHNRDIVVRFFNEAKAATAARHPGIVEIYDFGFMPSGIAYLVMELLEGETLSRRIKRVGRLTEIEACGLVRAITAALAAAHAQGIVHRDLKPDNIFLVPDSEVPSGERPKLLDFGIAKLGGTGTPNASMTRTGAVLGTPRYMSPEQCRGAGEVDHRADLYALGCILYELVTGRLPFTSDAPGELIANHMLSPVDPPSQFVSVSSDTEAIIMRLLAKRPGDRFASAAELVAALGPLSGFGGSMRTPTPYGSDPAYLNPSYASSVRGSTPAPGLTPYPASTPYPGATPYPGTPAPYAGTPAPGSYPGVAHPSSSDALTQMAPSARETTLGGSAGETALAAAPRRGRGAMIAAVAAVAIAAGGVAVVVMGGSARRHDASLGAAPSTGTAIEAGAPTTGSASTGSASTGSASTGSASTGSASTGKPPRHKKPREKTGSGSSSPVFDDI
jgi:eukaryotic-like serine/threonine-protein kinase